jgi:hypothetical protein
MEFNYTQDAFATLLSLINFIEERNTPGAGYRWFLQFEKFLKESFNSPDQFSICNNKTFATLNLYCIQYKSWLIAFTVKEEISIEVLLHKSRIVD